MKTYKYQFTVYTLLESKTITCDSLLEAIEMYKDAPNHWMFLARISPIRQITTIPTRH